MMQDNCVVTDWSELDAKVSSRTEFLLGMIQGESQGHNVELWIDSSVVSTGSKARAMLKSLVAYARTVNESVLDPICEVSLDQNRYFTVLSMVYNPAWATKISYAAEVEGKVKLISK